MKMALFFTRGVSLQDWVTLGLLSREKLLYETHLKAGNFKKIYWLTYGSNDKKIAEELKKTGKIHKDIEILPLPGIYNYKVGRILYSLLLPFVYRKQLSTVALLKTNQMDGCWSAVFAKWLYKKPLILRTGYSLSTFAGKLNKQKRLKNKIYQWTERFGYKYCDAGIVASRHDKQFLLRNYKVNSRKINVIYTYIDTTLFYPVGREKYSDRIVFIGRLSPQKNLANLITAIAKTKLTLDIYGQGVLREELEHLVNSLQAKVNFMGVIPNNELPAVLNKYTYYILPSLFEGMPKTLLEAQACGLVCIGTDVQGINEIIEDGVNGYLAQGTTNSDIQETIERALSADHKHIRQNAAKKIQKDFLLESALNKEMAIVEQLLCTSTKRTFL